MAPRLLTLDELLALVRFLLASLEAREPFCSPPPSAAEKLVLNLQDLLSERNMLLPEDISKAASRFLPSFSASDLPVPPSPGPGPIHPLQDHQSRLLSPAASSLAVSTPEPSLSPEVTQPERLIIRLPRRPRPSSPSFSEDRNVRRRLDLDLDNSYRQTSEPLDTQAGEEDNSGAACSAQKRPRRLIKSGTCTRQGGAPAPWREKPSKSCNRGGVRPFAQSSVSESRNPLFPDSDEELWETQEQGEPGRMAQTLHLLTHAIPVPEAQLLPPRPKLFLLALGATCESLLAAGEDNLVSQIITTLQGKVNDIGLSLVDNSLENLVERCFAADVGVVMNDFVYMISTIHLRSAVVREMNKMGLKQSKILKNIRCPKSRLKSLRRYINDGSKFSLLAGGGTIFLLIVMAVAKQRARVRDSEITEDIWIRLNYLLRCPLQGIVSVFLNWPRELEHFAEDDCGQLVISRIIPAISLLRQQHRITFSTLFSEDLLAEKIISPTNLSVLSMDLDVSADLDDSDFLFNAITANTILKPRDKAAWRSCYSEISADSEKMPTSLHKMIAASLLSLPTTTHHIPQIISTDNSRFASPPLSPPPRSPIWEADQEETSSPVFAIDTNFDFSIPANQSTRERYTHENKRSRYRYTQRQRRYADNATPAVSLVDFKEKICWQLKSGVRNRDDVYLELSHNTLEGRRLRVNAKNGEFVAIVLPDMPSKLRNNLMNTLKLVFPGKIKQTSSEVLGENFTFEALHFSWYNRFHLRGDAAASNEEPAEFELRNQVKTGKKKRCKTSQTMPHVSAELQAHTEQYAAISAALIPVFEWLESSLRQVLPAEVDVVSQFAEILPGGADSPAHPFGGFVVNFNVATKIHRDVKDKNFCVVIVITEDCQGGDLCLEELGVKFSFASGDVIVFPSVKISHFNTHFKGERASIVLHTDGAADSWVMFRNFWNRTLYLIDTDNGGGQL